MEPSCPRPRRARGHGGVSRVPESTPIYGLAVGLGEAGGVEGDGDGAGDGEGVGSGGQAGGPFGSKLITRGAPLLVMSFGSGGGGQTGAVFPKAPGGGALGTS